mmetsp:Transcript_26733/g.86555  ORF Transcript_26733/g.86555 Transcript_26733/m.86555 type:complete len:154 (-) Transcript_26733:618-1079(-)
MHTHVRTLASRTSVANMNPGTAEYIAPELLKGHKYGALVDWWSSVAVLESRSEPTLTILHRFGILLYEMMGFRTPFYEKNRKLMFHGTTTCTVIYTRKQGSSAVNHHFRRISLSRLKACSVTCYERTPLKGWAPMECRILRTVISSKSLISLA